MGDLEPVDAVDGEIIGSTTGVVARTWSTQAELDAVIDMPEVVLEMIKGSLAPNTWAAYRQQWANYLRWCNPPAGGRRRTAVPASLETILSYLGYLATVEVRPGVFGVSPSTMRQAMAAMRRFHSYGDPAPDWVGSNIKITDFLVGYEKKLARLPDRQPKGATGARTVVMRALLDALPDNDRGCRDRAILLLGYHMAARRSELAALTLRSMRYTQDGFEVYISHSKTDQAGQGAWVAVPAHPSMRPGHDGPRLAQYCPVHAAQAWIGRLAAIGVHEGPLFVPIDKYGNIRAAKTALSGSSFETVVSRARDDAYERAKAANDSALKLLLDPDRVKLTPHSLRRGFATDARAAAWDLLDISRHGRWSAQSRVVHIYIEEADRWLRHVQKPVTL